MKKNLIGSLKMVSVSRVLLTVAALAGSLASLPAQAGEISCGIKVGDVNRWTEDGQIVWGSSDASHAAYYKTRFPESPRDKLTSEEIAKIRSTENGLMLNRRHVYDTAPKLMVGEEFEDVLAFVNIANPAEELQAGNYVLIQSQKYKEDTYFINAIVYRRGQPTMHAYVSVSKDDPYESALVYDPRYAVEKMKHEREIAQNLKAVKDGKLSRDEAIERMKAGASRAYSVVGEGGVSHLMFDCSLQ